MISNPFLTSTLKVPGSSTFSHKHTHDTTFDMGLLIPCALFEVIPGDSWSIQQNNFARMQPMVVPPMTGLKLVTDYYFVPKRILWPNFEDFISPPDGAVAPLWPFMTLPELPIGSLGDYLGLPTEVTPGDFTIVVESLPIAAYAKIYDEWYRDQNLIDPIFQDAVNGENSYYGDMATYAPRKRAWSHDYFTSALPWAQKGDAVTLPVTEEGQLVVQAHTSPWPGKVSEAIFRRITDNSPTVGDVVNTSNAPRIQSGGSSTPIYYDPSGSLYVDVNDQAVTINSLRVAIRLQEFLEKDARGGTRYIETIRSHFGVMSSDKRLQRPEFIGRAKQWVSISQVLSQAETLTAEGSLANPVGAMAGHGISQGGTPNFRYYAEEHGFIMGIINVQPDGLYSQGIPKMWLRSDRLEYVWPEFAHLGEQEIMLQELWASNDVDPFKLFGYIGRYDEMRQTPNRISGDMRKDQKQWTWARFFESEPLLNQEFIECVPRTDMFAVAAEGNRHILAHMEINCTVNRKLPRRGLPTI